MSDDIVPHLNEFVENIFFKLTDILTNPQKLQEMFVHYNDYFDEFTSKKTLGDILDKSAILKMSSQLNGSLQKMFYGKKTINELLTFFTKGEFNSESKLSDMINGMLPEIIQNNLKSIINNSVLPAIREHKTIIRAEIMQKVPFGMGWAVKNDIDRTIRIILDEKIPLFLDEKITEINTIVQDVLGTQLIDLGYTKDLINQKKIDNLMSSIFLNKNFESSFSESMEIFVEIIFDIKIKTLLQMFSINKLSDIYTYFEKNITKIAEVTHKNIKLNEKEILDVIKELTTNEIAKDVFASSKISDVLDGIDKETLLREFEYLEKNLKESKEFQKSMQSVIDNFMELFLKKEFIQKDLFKEDLDKFLTQIINDKEEVRNILLPFFKEFIVNINNILNLKLKDHTLDIIIESAFESIHRKIADLIDAVDFKKVITKEIENMHPRELEEMFYSFAGPYFNKLILYGSMGFIFGLITLIQL